MRREMRMRGWLSILGLALLAAPATLRAQTLEDYDYENLAFRGFGVDVGRIWPNKVEPAGMYSLRVDLGYLGPGVRIAPSIGVWSSRLKQAELERLADQLNDLGANIDAEDLQDIDWSDLYLNLDAHLVWTTPLRAFTYVGAGVGFHALNGQGVAIQDTFVEDLLDSISASMDAIAGVEFEPVNRLRIYSEARFTLMSDIHYFGARIGGAFMLPDRGGTPTQE